MICIHINIMSEMKWKWLTIHSDMRDVKWAQPIKEKWVAAAFKNQFHSGASNNVYLSKSHCHWKVRPASHFHIHEKNFEESSWLNGYIPKYELSNGIKQRSLAISGIFVFPWNQVWVLRRDLTTHGLLKKIRNSLVWTICCNFIDVKNELKR